MPIFEPADAVFPPKLKKEEVSNVPFRPLFAMDEDEEADVSTSTFEPDLEERDAEDARMLRLRDKILCRRHLVRFQTQMMMPR